MSASAMVKIRYYIRMPSYGPEPPPPQNYMALPLDYMLRDHMTLSDSYFGRIFKANFFKSIWDPVANMFLEQ